MSQKSKNRLFTNMATYALLQIVNVLVGIVLPRLYLEAYGSEVNGIVSTINSFTSYFTYLEAGLGLTLIHALFKPLAEDDTGKLNSILSFSKKQYQNISFIYFALVIGLSIAFPFFQTARDIGRLEFMALVFVLGLYGACDFFTMAKYRVLLTADRKEYVISNAMILAQLLRFVFTWLLLRFDLSIVLVKTVPVFTLIIRSIILKIYVKKRYPRARFSEPYTTDVVSTSKRWDALLLQIAISTSVSLPAIIISQTLGYKEANVYAVYSLVISAMISIVSALSSGVSPMLGRSIALGEKINDTYRIYEHIVTYVITVVFAVTAVMLLPFVRLYTNVVNDINYIHPVYAVLISVWAALYSYRIPLTAVINAAVIYRENRVNNIINLLIQFAIGIPMTIWLGIPGLLITMIIASLQRNIWFDVANNRKLLHNSVFRCLVSQAAMTVMIAGSYFVSTFWDMSQIGALEWVLMAIAVAVIEAVICLIVFSLINLQTTRQLFALVKNKLKNRHKTA